MNWTPIGGTSRRGRAACARLALATLLVAANSACSHTAGVARRYDVRRTIEGSGRAGTGPARTALRVDEEALRRTLVLRGQVVRVADGVEAVEVESHAVHRVVPYGVVDAVAGRVVLTPLYFAVLGPLWGTRGDTDGDGRVALAERARFILAMLNPFEALPLNQTVEQDRVAATRREAVPAEVLVGGVPGALDIAVTTARREVALATTADTDGRFALPIDGVLADVGDEGPITIRVRAPDGAASASVGPLPDATLLEAVWQAGAVQQPGALTPSRRGRLAQMFRSAARGQRSRADAIEGYRRALLVAAVPDAAAAPNGGPAVALVDALARHGVRARPSGRGTSYVTLTLDARRAITVAVPAGTYFRCEGKAQNMVTTAEVRVALGADGSESVTVPAACANMHRPTPGRADTFTVEARSPDPDLQRLAPYLGAVEYDTRQAAVWIVTDDASRADFARYVQPAIGDQDILEAVALLRLAGVDVSRRRIHEWLVKAP